MEKAHREVELKFRLDGREAYESLCRGLGGPDADWVQVNHYFRSADGKIPGDRGVIRLRVEKGEAVFTVKLGGPLVLGLASAEEYEGPWEMPLDEIPLRAKLLWDMGFAGMNSLEKAFGSRFPLVWAGSMENRRRKYRFHGGLFLEVDASRYEDGIEDFEVELETRNPDQDRGLLESLLRNLDIPYRPQEETKYQRFLRHASTSAPPP